jgi:2,6-dihydroxypseudooxynicotine hydrolase
VLAAGDGAAAGRALSDEILARVWRANAIRLAGDGVPAGDIAAARQDIACWDEWYRFWAERGDYYEALARRALAQGRRLSAGELFWQACLSYHYAQFLWFHDPNNRDGGQRKKTALYREAAPLFANPAERFEIPFEGFNIPGYLRLPPAAAGRVPVALVLGGLESTKEESYRFENLCLARGLATCSFDGPGQGEMYFQAKMRPDFHGFASRVVDWLEQRPELDGGRIGVIGRSLGGYYAVHTAAHEPRLKACVCWGVLFDLSYYDTMHDPARRGFAYVAGFDDPDRAASYLQETIDLSGQAERVRCPVYALHGARDTLIPPQQVESLRAALKHHPDAEFDIPAHGDHCCHNLYHVVRPRMADWLAERLAV